MDEQSQSMPAPLAAKKSAETALIIPHELISTRVVEQTANEATDESMDAGNGKQCWSCGALAVPDGLCGDCKFLWAEIIDLHTYSGASGAASTDSDYRVLWQLWATVAASAVCQRRLIPPLFLWHSSLIDRPLQPASAYIHTYIHAYP